MLRGLDAGAAARSDYEPPVVRVAGREPLPVTVTIHVHERPSPGCWRRFEAALDRLELLEDAGIVRSVRAVAWPARAIPACDAEPAVRSLVRSFRRAAGPEAIEAFYDLDADAVTVPELALVVRRAGTITDLYPRRTDDGDVSAATGLERLVAGGDLETLGEESNQSVSADILEESGPPASSDDRRKQQSTPDGVDENGREAGGEPLTPP